MSADPHEVIKAELLRHKPIHDLMCSCSPNAEMLVVWSDEGEPEEHIAEELVRALDEAGLFGEVA